MEGNNLSGSLPAALDELSSLGKLNARKLIGINGRPDLIAPCSEVLSLGHNQLNGGIPDVFGGLQNLSEFIVGWQDQRQTALPVAGGRPGR